MSNRESSVVPIRYENAYSQSEQVGQVSETPNKQEDLYEDDYPSEDYDTPGTNYNEQQESDYYEEGTTSSKILSLNY